MKPIVIRGKYRVDRKIGQGGFGLVYAGTDIISGTAVAIKLTEDWDGLRTLEQEAETYRQLQGETGFPEIYWFGRDASYDVLILELLGPSLQDLFAYCQQKFSLKTILLIAEQALLRIECIHRHFLHRDIKPENFLLGTGKRGNIIYAVDFGLAQEFSDDQECKGYQGLAFKGTHCYASINCHDGLEQSWRDDLESLGYVLVYFARGALPWEGLDEASPDEKSKLIRDLKASLSGEELCKSFLPREFAEYIDYTRNLDFGEKPDYGHLRKLFRRRFRAEGFRHDNVFDWTERRYHEIRGELKELERDPKSLPTDTPKRKGEGF